MRTLSNTDDTRARKETLVGEKKQQRLVPRTRTNQGQRSRKTEPRWCRAVIDALFLLRSRPGRASGERRVLTQASVSCGGAPVGSTPGDGAKIREVLQVREGELMSQRGVTPLGTSWQPCDGLLCDSSELQSNKSDERKRLFN